MAGVQFEIKVIGGSSNQVLNDINSGLEQGAGKATSFNEKLAKIGGAAFIFNNISQAIGNAVNQFNSIIEPGIKFDSSLKEMQAITGVSNDKVKELGNNARQLAKDFGIDAAGAVESNKLLLSQLGPELGNSAQGLDAMSRSAAILSKQLGGDVAGATSILTTALNQYGISIDDPIAASKTMAEMMNIMAAAAKEGSAELPQIKGALEQSGMMAKTANVSFTELNSAIQVLDKAGKKGAEGGVAIRNVLAEMSQGAMNSPKTISMLQAAGISVDALADKSLSFSQRLAILKPLANDTAAMTQLFGKENVAAGIALVKNTGEMDKLTGKITGTNTATEMANTIMGSFSEKMARANSWFKDLGISIFNATSGFIPFIQMGMGGLQTVANLGGAVQAFSIIGDTQFGAAIGKMTSGTWSFISSLGIASFNLLKNAAIMVGSALVSIGSFIAGLVSATAAQFGLNIAMGANPIGLMVLGIAAVVAAIAGLIVYWDEITSAIATFASWIIKNNPFAWMIDLIDIIFPGFKKALGEAWDWIKQKFDALFGWIGKAWKWIKGLFGGGDDKKGAATPPSTADESAVKEFAANTSGMASATGTDGVSKQSAAINDSPLAGYKPRRGRGARKEGGQGATDAASNITSGGGKSFNLTINKLQDQTVINSMTAESGGKQMSEKIIQMILEQFYGMNAALGGS